MKIVAIRVDSRLIHGQTANLWHGYWGCDRFMVIDDETAHDANMKSIMRLAAPPGVKVSIIDQETAIKYLLEPNHYGNEKITIIVKYLEPIKALIENNIPFDCEVIVGQMLMGEGREVGVGLEVAKHIRCSQRDIELFHWLDDHGVRLYTQVTPQMNRDEFMKQLAAVEK